MIKNIHKLQYISQEKPFNSHLEAIENVLEAGCKWIQLRLKNKSEQEVISIAREAKRLCDKHQAILIINDYVKIAKEINADGVHIGLNDMSVAEARLILGENKIIGATANTIEDIKMHLKSDPDYIGVGPYRFTQTKEKLSPILGIDGYQKILDEMKQLRLNIPVIAVGGITAEDLPELLKTGIHGVAISGEINHAIDPRQKIEEINHQFSNSTIPI
ncbi:thiamine phosphate synthase [Belliella aquatica]|uniref:Thiamine-phosphate synthase n=1 Tax=Belliella aquatica TaxID=1323734 RepID=A0ABQ1MI20_9BACT|nr:thiamine phosphate synthase [Belliella aquatica]MCH7404966.1 thiamine phosphate synthase [Belliella aquatica]GGC40885.1 thiamine-phosphate synthase [Belliella aquatica]